MNHHLLLNCAARGSSHLRRCAEAALSGEAGALFGVHDYCHEEGLLPMQSVKVGEKYLFRTFAHYYKGRVQSVSFTDIVLTNCSTVYEEGPLEQAFGKEGQTANEEHFPPAFEVVLNAAHVVAAIPYMGRLHGEASR